MTDIYTRRMAAQEHAELSLKLWGSIDIDCTGLYEECFAEVMRMDDFDFLNLVHTSTGHWLKVISKNKYLLY